MASRPPGPVEPRPLQQQPDREGEDRALRRWQQQAGVPDFQPAKPPRPAAVRKGDVQSQIESPKPSRDREVGDLDDAEREEHGRACS